MTSAIVLAAGASSRMGRPKALLDIGGRAAVDVVCDTLRAGGADEVVVVVGKHGPEIRRGARLNDVCVVDNWLWDSGRTSSVHAGLNAISRDAEWTLLALVDMPLVRADSVRAIVSAAASADRSFEVVVPVHRGRRGHPIALRRPLFPRIAALGPDEPLYVVVRAARGLDVPVDDEGVIVDFDEPGDVRSSP